MSTRDMAEQQKRAEAAEVDLQAPEEAGATPDGGIELTAGEAQPSIEDLTQRLEQLQAKADGHFNDLLRARAEVENLRKRTARDIENAHKYGQERFLAEMLPVKDNMELGLSAAQNASEIATLREGMELTLKTFNQALEKLGVSEVNPLGERFNPELHQAISTQESEAEPNTVLTVVQKGYRLQDRLIRPALVIVARSREGQGST
ncbi:MAG: nucleotide exchange factor GrpE [Chromatiales bacterium]